MPSVEPWFTKPWRTTASGARPRIAIIGYVASGLCFLLLGLLSRPGATVRILWVAVAVVFLGLGLSLAATLRHRGRG